MKAIASELLKNNLSRDWIEEREEGMMTYSDFRVMLSEIRRICSERGCGHCLHYKRYVSDNPMECDEGCDDREEKTPFFTDTEGKRFPNYPECPKWELALPDGFEEAYFER